MVNRGLINKDAKVDVELNTIDAKYALGTYFYNSGARETYTELFNSDSELNWKISDHSLQQIGNYEKTRKTNSVAMRKKKNVEAEKRRKMKKYQCNPLYAEPGTYLTQSQKRQASLSDSISVCPKKKNK